MAKKMTFSQQDILRSKLLPPGWYPLLVKSMAEEQAGTDGSDLFVYDCRVETGPFKDVPLRFQISEKAPGFGIDFFEACGNVIQPGVQQDMGIPVGKHIDGYVQRGEYKGRPNNNLVAFRMRKTES